MSTVNEKNKIRAYLNQKREQLPFEEITKLSNLICKKIAQTSYFKNAKQIGLYSGFKGEVLLQSLWEDILNLDKQAYLPTLDLNKRCMAYFPWLKNSSLKPNRYGILEPDQKNEKAIETQNLDLVITPLVAFDRQGGRLGRGQGYYDQTFDFIKNHQKTKPVLFGVAYDFQEIEQCPLERWDIPLTGIMTETQYILVRPTEGLE